MQFLPTLTLVGCFAAAIAGAVGAPIRPESLLVRAVVDGDTIDVATIGRVRLLGIDAPELGRGFDTSAPFAREARDRLSSLVLHRWVRLEDDGATIDAYSRRLAYVIRDDGLFVNGALVREGLARISARVPLARLDELRAAERDAQAFRRGMWGDAPSPAAGYTHASAGTKSVRESSGKRRKRSNNPRHSPRK